MRYCLIILAIALFSVVALEAKPRGRKAQKTTAPSNDEWVVEESSNQDESDTETTEETVEATQPNDQPSQEDKESDGSDDNTADEAPVAPKNRDASSEDDKESDDSDDNTADEAPVAPKNRNASNEEDKESDDSDDNTADEAPVAPKNRDASSEDDKESDDSDDNTADEAPVAPKNRDASSEDDKESDDSDDNTADEAPVAPKNRDASSEDDKDSDDSDDNTAEETPEDLTSNEEDTGATPEQNEPTDEDKESDETKDETNQQPPEDNESDAKSAEESADPEPSDQSDEDSESDATPNGRNPKYNEEFVLTKFEDLKEALKHKKIKVGNLDVPAKVTLDFSPLKGTNISFTGKITFGFADWEGPLVKIGGKSVTVTGTPGNLFNGDGKRWWDSNDEIKKPKFLSVQLKDSTIKGLNFKNSPVHGISIHASKHVLISGITFNTPSGGQDTDAFEISDSKYIVIKNSHVINQDDCLTIYSGESIVFENNYCVGGHGISIGPVGGRTSNVVGDVKVRNNTVANSENGITIKTVSNAVGQVSNITFEDINLQSIRKVGIKIQGNYVNGEPTGDPTPGVPITGLTMKNIHGNVLPSGTNHLVWVTDASDWSLDSQIEGGQQEKQCMGFPDDVEPLC